MECNGQISMFDTGQQDRPCDYSFVRSIGQTVRRWRTGEIRTITEIKPYYTYLDDGSVATPYDICECSKDERFITIPDEIWSSRCRYCSHRTSDINWPFPLSQLDRPGGKPCRIIRLFKSKIPGECVNFTPDNVYGICETCEHNNYFCKGFCMKKGHAEQRRVFYGNDLGGSDYYGRHRFSTCADYEPKTSLGKLRKTEDVK